MAITRALFDRHNVTGDLIEYLRPVGTTLAPEVTVTIEIRGARYEIHKRFLHAPVSELREYKDKEWMLIDDGDAALTAAELKAGLSSLQTTLIAQLKEYDGQMEAIEKKEADREALSKQLNAAERTCEETRANIVAVNAGVEVIESRYAEGVEKARCNAQTAFVAAKAEREVAMKALPEDWVKLEGRHERALHSFEQVAREFQDLQQKRTALEAVLRESGSLGLYSRESTLLEDVGRAKTRANLKFL